MSDLNTNVEEPGVDAPEPDAPPERDWESEARQDGWVPLEEWKGDPDAHRSAEEFVKRGEELAPILKSRLERERKAREAEEKAFSDRLKRLEAMSQATIDRLTKQHEAEKKAIEARMEKAVEDGDLDAYKSLKQRSEALGDVPEVPQATEEPPEKAVISDWTARNEWYLRDPLLQSVANGAAEVAYRNGGDVHAQLAAAEAEVRQRFPEKFGNAKRQTVETGGQSPRPKKAKGVADLPAEAKAAGQRDVKRGLFKDMNEYAQEYWSQF